MRVALLLAWIAFGVATAWRGRPSRPRARSLARVPVAAEPGHEHRSTRPFQMLGGRLRRGGGRPADAPADLRLGVAVVAGATAALLAPPLVLVVAVVWWAWPPLASRRATQRTMRQLRAELPEVVDLFVLAIGAGLTVPLAVPAVGRRARGPLGAGLRAVQRETALGRRLADALAALPGEIGEPVRPLTAVLVESERYGVPLLPSLERLSAEVRLERRRHAEEAARRVPVKLLFPLVLCTLPAFALLTVVPLLAGSLRLVRL